LRLRRRLLLLRLGLHEKVLIAKEDREYQEQEAHRGAHIASTTAAASSLVLQIGIVNFGQRLFPIVC